MGKKKKLDEEVLTPTPIATPHLDLLAIATSMEEALEDVEAIAENLNPFKDLPSGNYALLCDYVRFSHEAVPPLKGKEPVWEIKLKSHDEKYRVDSIVYCEAGIVFSLKGHRKVVPLSNVAYAQPI